MDELWADTLDEGNDEGGPLRDGEGDDELFIVFKKIRGSVNDGNVVLEADKAETLGMKKSKTVPTDTVKHYTISRSCKEKL